MDLTKAVKIHEGKFSLVFVVNNGAEKLIVKQLHPKLAGSIESVFKFKEEATLPCLNGVTPKVLDFKEINGSYFIIKEYFHGFTLKQLHLKFARRKYQPLYNEFYIELCRKLTELHSEGIIHGDIKPSNLFFLGSDFKKDKAQVRLLDMGLALNRKQLPAKDVSARLPFSMLYAAPEIMLNEPAYISEMTDLFSVGVCMHESFSGEVPYKENHAAILLQMMLALPLKREKRIPENIFSGIETLTTKPAFMRPVAQYSVEDALLLLKQSLVKRLKFPSAESVAKFLSAT